MVWLPTANTKQTTRMGMVRMICMILMYIYVRIIYIVGMIFTQFDATRRGKKGLKAEVSSRSKIVRVVGRGEEREPSIMCKLHPTPTTRENTA